MKLSEAIKPISYLKGDANVILSELHSSHQPVIVTQDGQAKAVLQDIETYEDTQESIAILKMLSMSNQSKKLGNYKSVNTTFSDIRNQIDQSES